MRSLLAAVLLVGCAVETVDPGAPPSTTPPPAEIPPESCVEPRDPGRVTLHRLNRAEYDNTVRDLLSDTTRPARDFPADDHGHGFDNNADVLATSPLLVEKYEIAAENLVRAALAAPIRVTETRGEAETLGSDVGAATRDGWNLWSNGEIRFTHDFPHTGEYELSARAYQQAAGPDPARMQFLLDNAPLVSFDVTARQASPAEYRRRVRITAGRHVFAVEFTNDYFMPNDPDPANRDRNLHVDWLAVRGPLDADTTPNPVRSAIMICEPARSSWADCAAQIVAAFARRAWRRPITDAERARLVALTQVAERERDDFDTGVGLALQAILLSPHFLFRVELDPVASSTAAHPLDAHALAARLSYFLWSSTPDAELDRLADEGTLADPARLAQQVRRMLRDPKAQALVDNFGGQWLYTRALDDVNPDYAVYPDFDAALSSAMRKETAAVFGALLTERRSALDLLDLEYSFVNDRLAAHYGLPAVGGDALVRVDLPASGERGGLLTHASVLTVTSYPKRTSPVKRGKWVLDELLCEPPPAPPPGVEGLAEEAMPTGSLRQRLELHRTHPVCSNCHAQMDPLGFGLEDFDGIGKKRTTDTGGFAIDSSGELPDGRRFSGAKELARILKADPRTPRCFAERMFIYALGRGPTKADECTLEDIHARATEAGGSFEALAEAIVTSPAFTARRGEAE